VCRNCGSPSTRAFASQRRYHYITPLDDNQWSARKVRQEGSPERYRFGDATLYDCEIELKDSKEKGYLLVVRAIRIEWDYGKRTVEAQMRLLFFPFHKQFFQDLQEFRYIVFRDEPYPFNKDFSVFVSEYISLSYYLPPGNLGMFIL